MCDKEGPKVSPYFFLMFKLKIMGHIKNISQMIEDGSFDRGFVPAYEKAVNESKLTYMYAGFEYTIDYATNIVDLVNGFRAGKSKEDAIKLIKKFE